jgi:hypothetical protein
MNQINLTAYYENIKKKTGKTPDDFKELAADKGFVVDGNLKPTVKPTEVMNWLKADFNLGRGHGLALYHYFKEGSM